MHAFILVLKTNLLKCEHEGPRGEGEGKHWVILASQGVVRGSQGNKIGTNVSLETCWASPANS